MPETNFYIVENIRTTDGSLAVGKFFVGHNRDAALAIFRKLKGNADVDEKAVLTLELRETRNDLPLDVLMISCTLDEFAENCKIITRESFKFFNLNETPL